MADSAPAEGHNLGRQKHMHTWDRAAQGKEPGSTSFGVFLPVQWARSTNNAGAQDMVQMCRALPCELCSTTPGAFYGELASILLHLLRGGAIAHPVPATAIPNFLGFAASVRGTVPWWPLWLLPWPHGSVWEEAPAGSSQASAQEDNLQAQVPEGE